MHTTTDKVSDHDLPCNTRKLIPHSVLIHEGKTPDKSYVHPCQNETVCGRRKRKKKKQHPQDCHSLYCACPWLLSYVWLCATPWTVTRQAPMSLGFSRQEYWSWLPYSPSGDISHLQFKWWDENRKMNKQSWLSSPQDPLSQAGVTSREPAWFGSRGWSVLGPRELGACGRLCASKVDKECLLPFAEPQTSSYRQDKLRDWN